MTPFLVFLASQYLVCSVDIGTLRANGRGKIRFESDKPITQPLASSTELDERLRRTDEPRWLASRYAPADARPRLVAVWLLRQELHRALQASDPMLAKIRIQWWRETLAGLASGTPRRHDITEALYACCARRAPMLDAMSELIDRFDDVADDHLHEGGHTPGDTHAARHIAAEAASFSLAGLALVDGLTAEERTALGGVAEAWVALMSESGDARERWAAAVKAAQSVRSALWPAFVHVVIRPTDSALRQRWRIFAAVLLGRLPRC